MKRLYQYLKHILEEFGTGLANVYVVFKCYQKWS